MNISVNEVVEDPANRIIKICQASTFNIKTYQQPQ